MGRIKKGFAILTPIQRMYLAYGEKTPFRSGIDLVNWLNTPLSSSPADREAADRVGRLIKSMNGMRSLAPLNWGDRPREDWCVAKHRNVAPFYKFNFDLSPPIDGRKWRLFLKISFRNSEDRDQPRDATDKGQRIELGAVETVIDLALGGRLGTIKQCRIPDCCKWYTTKDDPRVLCCPDHSSDDLRKGTPERKEQLRTAAKKTRGDEKERQAQGWKDVGKKGDHKGPSRRAQKS